MIWVNTPQGLRLQAGAGSPVRYVLAGGHHGPHLSRPRPIGTIYGPTPASGGVVVRGAASAAAAASHPVSKGHGK